MRCSNASGHTPESATPLFQGYKKTLCAATMVVCLLGLLVPSARGHAKKTRSVQESLRIPDSAHVQIIKTYTGFVVIGRIVELDSVEIDFQTDMGRLAIPAASIRSIREVPTEYLRNGRYWFPNPNSTRLLFTPTGRMQRKGEGYFADYYVFFPMAAYGITDWIGIGGGMTLIPFAGIQNQMIYIMPRVGLYQSEKFSWCAGFLLAKFPEEILDAGGIVYSTATYGTPDLSLTAGTGYGFSFYGGWEGMETPMFMLGGEVRFARRASFVTENWFIPDLDESPPLLVSCGIRLFGEEISVDLGFINPLFIWEDVESPFPGVPYVDFVYNF